MADVTVTANQRLLNQVIQNVMVFNNLSDDAALLQSFADSFRASWSSGIAALLNSNWSMDNVTFTFNAAEPVYSLTVDFTSGVLVGGSSVDPMPTQLALLVSTSYAGPPPNRGRFYLAGTTENNVSSGVYNVTAYGAAEAMVQSWASGLTITGGTSFLRIARRNSSGIITSSNPVSNVIGRTIPAVQRRRRIGQGS